MYDQQQRRYATCERAPLGGSVDLGQIEDRADYQHRFGQQDLFQTAEAHYFKYH